MRRAGDGTLRAVVADRIVVSGCSEQVRYEILARALGLEASELWMREREIEPLAQLEADHITGMVRWASR